MLFDIRINPLLNLNSSLMTIRDKSRLLADKALHIVWKVVPVTQNGPAQSENNVLIVTNVRWGKRVIFSLLHFTHPGLTA